MIALVLVPLWLLMLLIVSGLCRAARAGDEAVVSSACADSPHASARRLAA